MVASHGKPFVNSPLGKSIKRLLDELAGIRYEFHPMVPFSQHAEKVCELALNIGIAPLVEDNFNRNKSCIKYYEYALSGAVTVASRVLPYSDRSPHYRQEQSSVLERYARIGARRRSRYPLAAAARLGSGASQHGA